MGDYYKSNAIYDVLSGTEHTFQWVSGNAWLLLYGNKEDEKAKVLVLAQGTSWEEQSDIINTLRFISKKLKIPVYRIIFDDSESTSISEIAFSSSLDGESEMYFLSELKIIFKNCGLNIVEGKCDKYLNDRTSSAYHKWQRNSLGNKIIVSDLDLIRVSHNNKEPIEFIELKRSTASVEKWKPYSDDFKNFNLLDTVSKQMEIPLSIVYNRMVKDNVRRIISEDIHDPLSIFSFTNNTCNSIEINYNFSKFLTGDYLIKNTSPICQSCREVFIPRIKNAPLCIECWKKKNSY